MQIKKNNIFFDKHKKNFLKPLSNWKKSSIVCSLFLAPILELMSIPIFILVLIYEDCSENSISFKIMSSPIVAIIFFSKIIIGCIFALFIGCLFLKFPRGKHMFFVLEPMMTIFISSAALIYLFFIPNGKIPLAIQIWQLVIHTFEVCT